MSQGFPIPAYATTGFHIDKADTEIEQLYKEVEDEISNWPDGRRRVCASSVKKLVITIEGDELHAGASSGSDLGRRVKQNPTVVNLGGQML